MATRTSGRTTATDGNTRGSGPQVDRSDRSDRRERNRPTTERNNRIKAIQSLFRDTVSEIRKVSWPDQQTTRNLTLIVIGTAVVLGTLLGGIDALFVRLWESVP